MAFVGVNKVRLEDTKNIKLVFGNTMLVVASMTHELVEEEKYNEALTQIPMLKCVVAQLEEILRRY